MSDLCDLDPVNFCCWTHGCDITEEEYIEGYCRMAEPDDGDDEEDYEDQIPENAP